MAKRSIRKFEAFVMHAHTDVTKSYERLFTRLSELTREKRLFRFEQSGLIVAFPIVQKFGQLFFVQAVEGDDASAALVLNTDTGQTRENILGRAEVLSFATHLVISSASRRAAIEFVQRGAKATVIGAAIEGILKSEFEDMSNLLFEFAPVIRKNFITEINAFERIREASLRVTKPNASWSDHYTDLSDLIAESKGDKAEIEIKAKRGQSLAKNTGIVNVIKDVVRDKQPYLEDAKVTGTRKNEENETSVHARKHVEHSRVSVNCDDAGVADADDIRGKLIKFLGSVTKDKDQ